MGSIFGLVSPLYYLCDPCACGKIANKFLAMKDSFAAVKGIFIAVKGIFAAVKGIFATSSTDKQPFMAAKGYVEARYYDQEFSPIKFTSRRKDGALRKAYMDSKGSVEIQKEVAKLLKVTTIVPYRLMSSPIIKEIDDVRLEKILIF